MSQKFDWHYPGLDWSRFHSLANLLSLRNVGQAEPSMLSNIALEEDQKPDGEDERDDASIDTRFANQLSKSGHERLKRRFLDCLAEIASNKKGGTAVACAVMKEAEDSITVWVTRNDGFSTIDETALIEIGECLSWSNLNSDQPAEAALWEKLVVFQQNRIECNYIPDLRAGFKSYDSTRVRSNADIAHVESESHAALSTLRNLLFDSEFIHETKLERYMAIGIECYNIRHIESVKEQLNSSPKTNTKSKGLWVNICLLARLRIAFEIFKAISVTLPSFETLEIRPVCLSLAPSNPHQSPLTLKQTFGLLQIDLGPDTVRTVLGMSRAVTKIEREFSKRQKQRLNIHAEVQMLLVLNESEPTVSDVFPYFGCSKLSCFMCYHLIKSYGEYRTRGTHGRLFKPWTVPNTSQLISDKVRRIAKALIMVQNEVVKKLLSSVQENIQHQRTSVVGGSTVMSGFEKDHAARKSQADRLRLKVERDRVAESFRRRTETHHSPTPFASMLDDSETAECSICEKPTTRKCSFCNKDYFCSEACEAKQSIHHLFRCSKRPLTSADYLAESLIHDLMPEDEDVLRDFGFNNIPISDRSNLFGLYRGLYIMGDLSAESLHEWRIKGILWDQIKNVYYEIPEQSRGGYFPWFLQNCESLQRRPLTQEEAQQNFIENFYEKAKPYLPPEDREIIPRDLKPDAKRDSYNLLAAISHRASPNPIETNYYSFGFVTCRAQGEESILVGLYQLLLTDSDGGYFYEFYNSRRRITEPVSFTEFWKAFESHKLIQLMDSRDLKTFRSRLPFLEEFLSPTPTGLRPSVWSLKQFLEINDPVEHPPDGAVSVDYGFINCKTFENTCTLMEIYGTVLKAASPLDLHKACIKGDLYQFVGKYTATENRWRSLLRNFYPLK